MATKFEYYNTGEDFSFEVQTTVWDAQTFTPSASHTITSVKLLVGRLGASLGTVIVSIRAVDGSGHPTGGDLCSGTTDGDTIVADPATEWREITFSTGHALAAGTVYSIVVRAPDATLGSILYWWADSSSPSYAGGNLEDSVDSGVNWDTYTAYDLMFEDWGIGGFTPRVFII